MFLRCCFRSQNRLRASLFVSSRIAAALLALVLVTMPRLAWADKWALLIGIDQYEDTNHIASLGGASADAKAMKQALIATGYPEEQVKTLTSDGETKPTRTEILKALAWLSNNVKPGDTVFVLYSGHGIDVKGTPYLLPYDTSALNDDTITDTALETSKFRVRLGQLKARAMILAFDMCRSDPFEKGKGLSGADNLLSRSVARGLNFSQVAKVGGTSLKSSAASPIAVTLYSCAEGQRSYEWQDKGRGYFSYYLEKGLRGAAADPATGQVTVRSLTDYVGKNVKAAVDREEHHEQTPYPSIDGPGAADYVIVLKPTTAVAATQPEHTSRPPAIKPPKTATPIKTTVAPIAAALDRPAVAVVNSSAYANLLVHTGVFREFDGYRALAVAFSPDGKYIASSITGSSGTGAIWNARSRIKTPVCLLTGQDVFNAVAFSPDSQRLVTAGSEVKVWNVTTGAPCDQMETEDKDNPKALLGVLNCAAYSPDGKHIVAGGNEGGRVWVWNAETGDVEHVFMVHQDGISTVAYSPDGRSILSCSADGTAKIIDAKTGQTKCVLSCGGSVNSGAFSHDGRYVVTGGVGNQAVRWDAASGVLVDSCSCPATLHSVAFSSDDRYILTAGEEGSVLVWNLVTGNKIPHKMRGGVTFADFSPGGKYIVVGESNGEVLIIKRDLE